MSLCPANLEQLVPADAPVQGEVRGARVRDRFGGVAMVAECYGTGLSAGAPDDCGAGTPGKGGGGGRWNRNSLRNLCSPASILTDGSGGQSTPARSGLREQTRNRASRSLQSDMIYKMDAAGAGGCAPSVCTMIKDVSALDSMRTISRMFAGNLPNLLGNKGAAR